MDLLVHTNKQGDTPESVFEQIVGGRTDGALLYVDTDSSLLRYFEQSVFPIVSVGPILRGYAVDVDQVDIDAAEMEPDWSTIAARAVEELVERIDGFRAARYP